MKSVALLLLSLFFSISVSATSLVLIPIKSFQETKAIFNNSSIRVHFYNDRFVIATTEVLSNGFVILDKNPWQKDVSYYLVYIDESVNKTDYLSKIRPFADVLHEEENLLVVRSNEKIHGQLPPAKNDGMVRIDQIVAKLPDYNLYDFAPTDETESFVISLIERVNGKNITSTVQHLQDYDTRNAYSSQSVLAQEWIATQFEEMGLSVEVMDFEMPAGPASDNVIATLEGTTLPNEFVVVGAHYDSRSVSGSAPGADDNASGTAGVLEIARILSRYDFDRSIVFCTFSGEEYGLYGSKAYANRSAQEGKNILGYINLDMIGYLKPGNTMLTSLIYPQSAKPLADFYSTVTSIYLPDFIVQPATLSGGDSDHTSFNINGYMGIFPFENVNAYSPYIHTSNDLIGPSYNSEAQAVVFTQAALATLVTLAKGGLTSVLSLSSMLEVYPNPANDFVSISLSWDVKSKLEVISYMGSVVHTDYIKGYKSINTSSWQPGVYLFRIFTPEKVVVRRVIIY